MEKGFDPSPVCLAPNFILIVSRQKGQVRIVILLLTTSTLTSEALALSLGRKLPKYSGLVHTKNVFS